MNTSRFSPPPSVYESPASGLIRLRFERGILDMSFPNSNISDTEVEDDWGEL